MAADSADAPITALVIGRRRYFRRSTGTDMRDEGPLVDQYCKLGRRLRAA